MPNLPHVLPGDIITANAWNTMVDDLNPFTQALKIVDSNGSTMPVPGTGGNLFINGVDSWQNPGDEAILFLGNSEYFIKAKRDQGLTIGAKWATTGIVISDGGDTRIGGGAPARAKLEIDGGDEWVTSAWHKSLLLTAGNPSVNQAGNPSITFDNKMSSTKFGIGLKDTNGVDKLHVFSTDATLGVSANDGSFISHLVIQENGNVGIGVDTPTAKLQVESIATSNTDDVHGIRTRISGVGTLGLIERAAFKSEVNCDNSFNMGLSIAVVGNGDKSNYGVLANVSGSQGNVAIHGVVTGSGTAISGVIVGSGQCKAVHGKITSSGPNRYAGFFEGPMYVSERIGIGNVDPKTSLHINSIRPILMKNNGSNAVYGSEIGFNAILDTDTIPAKFIKLGGTDQKGGASIVVDHWGEMYFQLFNADNQAQVIVDYKPQFKFSSNGEAYKFGTSNWSILSDVRVKTNINEFSDSLEKLKQVTPISYEYNGLAGTNKGITYFGLVAQEVQKIFPYMVDSYRAKLKINDENESDVLTLNTSTLIYVVINAIKEIDKRLSKIEHLNLK